MNTFAPARLATPVSDRDHVRGSYTAPVTLVEYGDYECPHCGSTYPIVEDLIEELGDELRFVYRHFPLSEIHPHAQHAAQAAECAGAQGRFWDMHHVLFRHQDALDDLHLVLYAEAIGLDVSRFQHDLSVHACADRIREDFLSGARSGVNGTPTFFIQDIRYEGHYDFDSMYAALQAALRDARHAR